MSKAISEFSATVVSIEPITLITFIAGILQSVRQR